MRPMWPASLGLYLIKNAWPLQIDHVQIEWMNVGVRWRACGRWQRALISTRKRANKQTNKQAHIQYTHNNQSQFCCRLAKRNETNIKFPKWTWTHLIWVVKADNIIRHKEWTNSIPWPYLRYKKKNTKVPWNGEKYLRQPESALSNKDNEEINTIWRHNPTQKKTSHSFSVHWHWFRARTFDSQVYNTDIDNV